MGLFDRFAGHSMPDGIRAGTIQEYNQAFFGGDPIPDLWLSALAGAGVSITPEIGLTLSAYYAGVKLICYDLATLAPTVFKRNSDGGKTRVQFSANGLGFGGIGDLAAKPPDGNRITFRPRPNFG